MGRQQRWMLFFVILGVLALLAIFVPMVFNLYRQLRVESVASARERWQAHGPSDYDLHLLIKGNPGETGDRYRIQVRDDVVVQVSANHEILYQAPEFLPATGLIPQPYQTEEPQRYRVEGLMDEIERMRRQDLKEGKRNYTIADFHKHDGHPTHYVRRDRETKTRREWILRLERMGE